MNDRQFQKAGSGSTQIQVLGNVQLGISEERVRQIMAEREEAIIHELSAEAHATAKRQVEALRNEVVAAFTNSGDLSVFSDPGFQLLLEDAQRAAVASDRPEDIELIVQLLRDRANTGKDRAGKTQIKRAMRIIDEVDPTYLDALTVYYFFSNIRFGAYLTNELFRVNDALLQELMPAELPEGNSWLEHLEIVGAVRLNDLTTLKRALDVWAEAKYDMIACAGVPADEFEGVDYVEFFPDTPRVRIIDHDLRPGYSRLALAFSDDFATALRAKGLSDELVGRILDTANSRFEFGTRDTEVRQAFGREARQFSTLAKVWDWWDSIPGSPAMTALGRTLALANARRLNSSGVYANLKA